MPCEVAFDAGWPSARSDRPKRSPVGPTSPPVRGEVLVILRRGPAPSPSPADPPEDPDDDLVRDDHPRPDVRPVEVPATPARRDVRANDVRVLDRVEVDRAAVGVLGPGRGPRDVPAIERGC